MRLIAYLNDITEGKVNPVHLENGDLILLIKRGQEVYALDAV